MSSTNRFRNKWLSLATLCVVTLGLVVYLAPSLYAQDSENGDGSPFSPSATATDDVESLWENTSGPYFEKPDTDITYTDDVKEIKQFEYSLFLPSAGSVINAQSASTQATWQTIHLQTFESTFPPANDKWSVRDYNGPNVGVRVDPSASLVWDDNSIRAKNGYWSAHPNDWKTYANLTDTSMRYGPFSLVGARDAKVDFWYWLDTEVSYDSFSIEYSCNANLSNWHVLSLSGSSNNAWVFRTIPLTACTGYSTVYVRFSFKSDYSNPSNPVPTGVWVDDIKISKYQ